MVYHILADGTVTKDITGKVVKMEYAKPLYDLMSVTKKKAERGGKRKVG